ncbi:helix-turn-helix domain-containing protein [Paracoccus alkanivorans]|uniref:helix-turn-helix domain-containing protein n=1 Tax=Paracoccus alkanivorans TaxID=2116655 RepID=UPI001408C3ED|nr:helix-turn-helix domain-containing protein [Paracoccus alkanivorans]
MPPRTVLYWERMRRARNAFLGDLQATSPADIARRFGFVDLDRFVRRYHTRYGETPAETFLQRRPASLMDETGAKRPLTPAKIDLLRHHIDNTLGDPITVDGLARLVGMTSRALSAAFKDALGVTPA